MKKLGSWILSSASFIGKWALHGIKVAARAAAKLIHDGWIALGAPQLIQKILTVLKWSLVGVTGIFTLALIFVAVSSIQCHTQRPHSIDSLYGTFEVQPTRSPSLRNPLTQVFSLLAYPFNRRSREREEQERRANILRQAQAWAEQERQREEQEEAGRRANERRRAAEEQNRRRAAQERSRKARVKAEIRSDRAQEQSRQLLLAFDEWCQQAANLSRQVRSGQQPMAAMSKLPLHKGVTVDCEITCQAIKRERSISFCQHSIQALIEAYVRAKTGSASNSSESQAQRVLVLSKLVRLWHPDRFVRGTNLLRTQVEEMSKIVNNLYSSAQATRVW